MGRHLLSSPMKDMQSLIEEFTKRLMEVIEASASEQARSAVFAALGEGVSQPRRRGRPPKALQAAGGLVLVKHRKKAPIQLCPVPGCKNPAAPIFGMVCAKHKGLPKATIKKYREARRLAKAKAAGKAPPAKREAKQKARRAKKAVRAKKPVKKAGKRRASAAKPATVTSPASSPAAAAAQSA
jgi:hypothetical protein